MYSFLIFIVLYVFLSISHANSELPDSIQSILKRYAMPEESLGIYVQNLETGEAILRFNENKPYNPASTTKILTTWAALETLKPAYSWQTKVFTDGEVKNGRLIGNIILQGLGDPSLSVERFWLLLVELRAKGLKEIYGDLILDNSYFSSEVSYGEPFDQNIYSPYNVLPNALLFNQQKIRIQFFPDEENNILRINTNPNPSNLIINNGIELTNGKCGYSLKKLEIEIVQENIVNISGKYPISCGNRELSRILMSNEALIYGIFQNFWQQLGGSFQGQYKVAPKPASAELFYSFNSLPLVDLIKSTNKFSNNVTARHLFLTLGTYAYGHPATLEKSQNYIYALLKQKGLHFPELSISNGSGLSRTTTISPRSMGYLLTYAYKSPIMSELMSSLPIAGHDGTLWRRFRDSPWQGRMHLKTGTLRGVKAIAGYGLSQSNQRYVIVTYINYDKLRYDASWELLEAVLEWVYWH